MYKYIILCVIAVIYFLNSCTSEPAFPLTLVLYSPGDPEYTDVLVKREHDNLTLVCELRGDSVPRSYVWNYVNNGTTGHRAYSVEPAGLTTSSSLLKQDLQLSDSGQYMCSAPPFSVTKYILVQTKGPRMCARGAFWCGARCVLPAYVCDGLRDCARGEDEQLALCGGERGVCARGDKLNCSTGRCISLSACCRGRSALCRQPACCDEYPIATQLGFPEEYPPLFEDRHAPDDYGFIQSTIYTVTACALIFMIAVVLLVSAICKMHMKRAALRGYSSAARHHYTLQYAQTHRFPPCYEASRLLEENRTGTSPPQSPTHLAPAPALAPGLQSAAEGDAEPRGLASLSAIFSARYRQTPSPPPPVELVSVPPSPSLRPPAPLRPYCSPAYQGDADFIFTSPESGEVGRELNYLATSVDCCRTRRRALPLPLPLPLPLRRNTLERLVDQLDRQRLTLQLGRFQLSVPGLGRPRADTPTVPPPPPLPPPSHTDETYTLNGRTIRLLGAELDESQALRPPSYSEALGYKWYGPPPQYASRDGLHGTAAAAADCNVELPPRYDRVTDTDTDGNGNPPAEDAGDTFRSIVDNLPAIDCDVNANLGDGVGDALTARVGDGPH